MGKSSAKKPIVVPGNRQATEFLRGKASQIFEDVVSQDDVVVVNKHSKPHVVIISYERYLRLKEDGGADI